MLDSAVKGNENRKIFSIFGFLFSNFRAINKCMMCLTRNGHCYPGDSIIDGNDENIEWCSAIFKWNKKYERACTVPFSHCFVFFWVVGRLLFLWSIVCCSGLSISTFGRIAFAVRHSHSYGSIRIVCLFSFGVHCVRSVVNWFGDFRLTNTV